MKKSLLTLVFCLMLCLSPFTTFAAHAAEYVDWQYGEDGLITFVADEKTEAQLTAYFYLTDRYTDEWAYPAELYKAYNLHLAIGVIGEEPAENIRVRIDIDDADDIYHNIIKLRATISADNYKEVLAEKRASFYYDENCQVELLASARLVRDRTDFSSGTEFTMDDLGNPILLSDIDSGTISPGTENVCEIVVPCIFSSNPPIFTEDNQPPQARLNAIADNPTIGDETVNSIWLTDESDHIVDYLAADHTYTAHFYLRASGPDAATNVNIQSYSVDERRLRDGASWDLCSYVKSDNARSLNQEVEYFVKGNLELHYIDGSLLLRRDGQEDVALNPIMFFSSRFSDNGVKIGTAGLDGVISPGLESACEVTYQFSTIDLNAGTEKETATEETKIDRQSEIKTETGPTFSDKCSVWLTDKNGDNNKFASAGNTYTVHARIKIDGAGQAEGVRISGSDPSILVLGDDVGGLYFKLMADNLEDDTMVRTIQRSAHEKEPLTFKYVKGSLQAKSAAGAYSLSDKEFFDYGTGCLVGFNGADGIIPVGEDGAVEIIYQIEAIANADEIKLSSAKIWRSPVLAIILLIVSVAEFISIICMAFHPYNFLARFVERGRRFWKSFRTSFAAAREEMRTNKSTKTSVDTSIKQDASKTSNGE